MTQGVPKTLLEVNGKTIIQTIIENACAVNIKKFIVIIGYQHKYIMSSIKKLRLEVEIEFVYNSNWKKANGISVLLSKPYLKYGEPFMISMGDHIYGEDLFSKVFRADLDKFEAIVGLDFRVDQVFDIDDAMKVIVEKDNPTRLTSMSKDLSVYDAIDCGVFKCNYQFFNVLEKLNNKKDFSLSDACRYLIKHGSMGGIDIKNSFWMDIDTPESFNELINY